MTVPAGEWVEWRFKWSRGGDLKLGSGFVDRRYLLREASEILARLTVGIFREKLLNFWRPGACQDPPYLHFFVTCAREWRKILNKKLCIGSRIYPK